MPPARDFVFVHINKTGGTSIEAALGLKLRHRTAAQLRHELGREEWARRFTFAFVRNPWDKVVSHYHYRVKTNQTGLRKRTVEFNDWVRLAYGARDPQYYDKPRMFMPQLDWLTDRQGRILVNFVGRFERLEQDFGEVCRELGISAELPHLKSSGRRSYVDLYAPDTAEIVAERFAPDLREFGYVFK